jgi:hypothetical protein
MDTAIQNGKMVKLIKKDNRNKNKNNLKAIFDINKTGKKIEKLIIRLDDIKIK